MLDDPDGGRPFLRLNAQLIGLLFHGMADYARLLEAGESWGRRVPPRGLFVSNLIDSVVAVIEAPISAETARELAD